MTLDEFFFWLERDTLKWRTIGEARILRTSGEKHKSICPLCAVANYILHQEKYGIAARRAARTLGMDKPLANQIIQAADGKTHNKALTAIRERLIQAINPTHKAYKTD